MSNVVCQALFELSKTGTFELSTGLVNQYPAPKKLADVVRTDFGLPESVAVFASRISRFSEWGTCAVGDVVLVRDGRSFLAGRVWRHVRVNGDSLSLIQLGDCIEYDRGAGHAVWRMRDVPEWGNTEFCLDSLIFTWLDAVTIRTLLPSQFRW